VPEIELNKRNSENHKESEQQENKDENRGKYDPKTLYE